MRCFVSCRSDIASDAREPVPVGTTRNRSQNQPWPSPQMTSGCIFGAFLCKCSDGHPLMSILSASSWAAPSLVESSWRCCFGSGGWTRYSAVDPRICRSIRTGTKCLRRTSSTSPILRRRSNPYRQTVSPAATRAILLPASQRTDTSAALRDCDNDRLSRGLLIIMTIPMLSERLCHD